MMTNLEEMDKEIERRLNKYVIELPKFGEVWYSRNSAGIHHRLIAKADYNFVHYSLIDAYYKNDTILKYKLKHKKNLIFKRKTEEFLANHLKQGAVKFEFYCTEKLIILGHSPIEQHSLGIRKLDI